MVGSRAPGTSSPAEGGAQAPSVGRDEVDELLDPADEGRLQVGPRLHPRQDPLRPDVAGVVLPAQAAADAFLPGLALRHGRPLLDADDGGLDRLQDVDELMADHYRVRAGHLLGDPRLLRPAYQVVDEHAEPPPGARPELADDRRQVVDAVQRLDDDALDAQVVAPDLLHELGIVLALDVDAPLAGDPRLGPGDVGGAGRAPRRCG